MTRERWVPVLIVLLLALVGAARGAAARHVPGDFLRYHRAGRLVATGRADRLYDVRYQRGQHVYAEERAADRLERGDDADDYEELEWKYLPATAVLLAPLGALHPRTGTILWGLWNGFLIGITFVAAWRFAAPGLSAKWMALPCLALLHAANDNMNLGQMNPSAIAPATVAVVLLAARRDAAAGLVAAFGAVVKFMPGFLVIWFAWKRRWRAVGALVGGMLLLGWGLPAVVLGPARATELTREYFEVRSHHYTSAKARDLPGHSYKSLAYRLLGETPYVRKGRHPVKLDVSVARVPDRVLFWGVGVLSLIVLGIALWAGRGHVPAWGHPRGPPEAGAFLATLLLVSPEARGPHFLYLALPAVALTYGLVRARVPGGPQPRWWKLSVAASVVAALLLNTNSKRLVGRALSTHFTAYCALGFAATAVFVVLVVLAVRARRGDGGGPDARSPARPPAPA